jgi:hypothetical protein
MAQQRADGGQARRRVELAVGEVRAVRAALGCEVQGDGGQARGNERGSGRGMRNALCVF